MRTETEARKASIRWLAAVAGSWALGWRRSEPESSWLLSMVVARGLCPTAALAQVRAFLLPVLSVAVVGAAAPVLLGCEMIVDVATVPPLRRGGVSLHGLRSDVRLGRT